MIEMLLKLKFLLKMDFMFNFLRWWWLECGLTNAFGLIR
jgi:hypothetical protein